MSNFEINDYILRQEAKALAKQAIAEVAHYGGDHFKRLEQAVDGHEWVIYTYKALLLCAECDTSDGEQWLEDIGSEPTNDIGKLATLTAYATLLAAARDELCKLI